MTERCLPIVDISGFKDLVLRKIYENISDNLVNEDYVMKNWYQLIEDLP